MSNDLAQALDTCLAMLARGYSPEQCLARFPKWRAELAGLLRTTIRMQATEPVVTPEALREAGRVRLMNRVAAHPRPVEQRRKLMFFSLPRWSALASAIAGLLAIALVSGGAVVASANALPDEPLYPLKRAVESARLSLALDDNARANMYLQFAGRRLDEESQTAQRGQVGAADGAAKDYRDALDNAIRTIEKEQARGGDVEAIVARLGEHLQSHQERMTEVLGQVPPPAQPAIERAMEASRNGQVRATEIKERKESSGGKGQGVVPGTIPAPKETATSRIPGQENTPAEAKDGTPSKGGSKGRETPPGPQRDATPDLGSSKTAPGRQ